MSEALRESVRARAAGRCESCRLPDSRPPDFPPDLPYPRPRDEPILFRAEVMEPGESFDQTGFELPPPLHIAPTDTGQGELFGDNYSEPDSADREPVFWSASGGQASPDDDFVQADAAESR